MSETVVYELPRRTFVNIVRLVLTHKRLGFGAMEADQAVPLPGTKVAHRARETSIELFRRSY